MPQSAVLFVIDGLRPDGLQRAETPHIDQLIARGVSPHRIWLGPRGEAMPETATADGEKNAENRRATIVLEMPLATEMISAEGCAKPLHMTDAIS